MTLDTKSQKLMDLFYCNSWCWTQNYMVDMGFATKLLSQCPLCILHIPCYFALPPLLAFESPALYSLYIERKLSTICRSRISLEYTIPQIHKARELSPLFAQAHGKIKRNCKILYLPETGLIGYHQMLVKKLKHISRQIKEHSNEYHVP